MKNDRLMDRIRLTQERKLIKLGLRTATESNDPKKVIFNFSKRNLTSAEESLLVKGLNLSVPPKKLNYGDFLLPFERLYKDLDKLVPDDKKKDSLEPVGAAIKDAAFECFHTYDPKNEQNLPAVEYDALKTLLKDDSIIIQKSDKGNSVVILNKEDYISKMEELLQDVSKFQRLKIKEGQDYNYLINQELRISKFLRSLKEKEAITEHTYKKLNPTGTQPSVLYGLAKVHKPAVNGVPKLRPILSAINSPTYNMSQYLNEILKPFTTNQYTVKDSFSFATEIRAQQSSCIMGSLDVDSLFTNIPLTETIEICCELVFRGKMIVNGLDRTEFKELLTLATRESLILFNGKYYKQIDGVAMGSPLGPTLANIFLGYKETEWLSNCPSELKPSYYRRYVDDIFLLFDNDDVIVKFQEYMNLQHANIHFTSEVEENDSIPFLDVFVTRIADTFVTSVYRKPTFSGVYTHYDSFLPSKYKTGLVTTLLFRAYTISSSWTAIDSEIKVITDCMIRNGYPDHILCRLTSAFLNGLHTKKPPQEPSTSQNLQIVLPFLGTFTRKVEIKIKKSVRQFLPTYNITFVYRAATRLRTMFAFKDRVPSYLAAGIVYKFTCGGCNSTYIGESVRHAKRRYCEHMGVSALSGKPLKGQNSTNVRDHLKRCNAVSSLENFKIICRDSNEINLRIKESLFINKDSPDINIQGNSIKLLLF